MKKKKTQLLGIVLSAAMLATSVPAPVYAEPTDNVAEEEDSDAAAVQETTDEADAVADDATDDSTAADDATPEEADEQDTADEADAQAAEEGDNEVKVDGGYTISIPTINFQGANAAVAEQMAKDVEIDESDPAIQSLRKALEEHEYPVEIREITERPYFHFKTDRKGLTAQILKELEQTKEEK